MAKSKVQKNKRSSAPNSYFALKSNNEIYYQMASIFRHASSRKNSLAERMVYKSIIKQTPNIFMENLL